MNKKKLLYFVAFSILILPLLSLVSAQYYGGGSNSPFYLDLGQGVTDVIDQIVRFLTPIMQVLIGDYSNGEFFFTKVMLLILLFTVIFVIMNKLPLTEGYVGISFVIALTISLISVRFISESQIVNAILLPYTTLGIAISILLPGLIFFYFIHTTEMGGLGRKISWTFFIVIFVVLWLYKAPEIGPVGNQIYFILIIVMGVMLFFDKSIHHYFKGGDVKKWEKDNYQAEIVSLQNQIADITRASQSGPLSRDQESRRRKISRRLRKLTGRKDYGYSY
ncbi:MAG: hypothetical protein AABX03_01750 [Nanoarchaeota archaeon]